MDSRTAAHVLRRIAAYLELKGENRFKTQAYLGAAKGLLAVGADDLKPLYESGDAHVRSRPRTCDARCRSRSRGNRGVALPRAAARVDARRFARDARSAGAHAGQDPADPQRARHRDGRRARGSGARRPAREAAQVRPENGRANSSRHRRGARARHDAPLSPRGSGRAASSSARFGHILV